ncbi:MAG: DUF1080 domain-containing protein [Thermoleophilia bacterium]|nr:DUF1080 domain-containing protein [Thermoleophilia bacterium]
MPRIPADPRPSSSFTRRRLFGLLIGLAAAATTARADDGWIDLSGLDAWTGEKANWKGVSDASVALKPGDPKKLAAAAGAGAFFNGDTGRAANLISAREFGDVELHLEFNVPKGSNSGVKLEGVYEIQIFDSFGIATPTASHCGGVYPRAELLPRYRHIDKGYPPKVNACKPPGEWQTLDIVFKAPKFDASGKKTANARFVSVKLNGQVVQEDLDVPSPTGHVWRNPEHPAGPILLQGDHGPVAFRNIRVRPLPAG